MQIWKQYLSQGVYNLYKRNIRICVTYYFSNVVEKTLRYFKVIKAKLNKQETMCSNFYPSLKKIDVYINHYARLFQINQISNQTHFTCWHYSIKTLIRVQLTLDL